MKENADVKIDGVKIEGAKVASKTPGVYTLTTSAIANNGIFAKGDHEVVVYDAEDTLRVNPNKASILTTKYTVASDTTAPEVKELKAINSRTFKVKFSEPLSQQPEVTVKKVTTRSQQQHTILKVLTVQYNLQLIHKIQLHTSFLLKKM